MGEFHLSGERKDISSIINPYHAPPTESGPAPSVDITPRADVERTEPLPEPFPLVGPPGDSTPHTQESGLVAEMPPPAGEAVEKVEEVRAAANVGNGDVQHESPSEPTEAPTPLIPPETPPTQRALDTPPARQRFKTIPSESLPGTPWYTDFAEDSGITETRAKIIVPEKHPRVDYSDLSPEQLIPITIEGCSYTVPYRHMRAAFELNADQEQSRRLCHDSMVLALAATTDEYVVNTMFWPNSDLKVSGDVTDLAPRTIEEMIEYGKSVPVGTVLILSSSTDRSQLYSSDTDVLLMVKTAAGTDSAPPLYISKFGQFPVGFHGLETAAEFYRARSMGTISGLRSFRVRQR